MNLIEILQRTAGMLAEGAVAERLRRRNDVSLHPTLFNTPLIYDDYGRKCLTEIYAEYRIIAKDLALPILLLAPTWRVNQERIHTAGILPQINQDAVRFMRELQKQWHTDTAPVFVGGLIGPKNDCYTPQEALSQSAAETFHTWQVEKLVLGDGVDCILGQTFPAVSEALGAARACEKSTTPYIISFVTDKEGRVLDGTSLSTAISIIDAQTQTLPLGYMVNCVHPSFLLSSASFSNPSSRLIGIMANASSISHNELEGATAVQQDSLDAWSAQMLTLNKSHGIKILGGCCGTDNTHIARIANGLSLLSLNR